MVTGSVDYDKSIPITFDVIRDEQIASINGSPPQKRASGSDILLGVHVHGRAYSDGDFQLTDLDGKELSPEDRRILILIFEQMAKSFSRVGTRSIAVGESFIEKRPINLQIPGAVSLRLEMTIASKLMKIENKLAYFDTVYNLKFDAIPESQPTANIEASGEGSGNFVYAIDKKTVIKSANKMKMEMAIPIDGGTILISNNSTATSITEVKINRSTKFISESP